MVADLLGQVFAGGNAQFGRKHLDQHRHQVSPHHDPQQLVAKAGAGLNVSGEITRIDIANGSDESRAIKASFTLRAARLLLFSTRLLVIFCLWKYSLCYVLCYQNANDYQVHLEWR